MRKLLVFLFFCIFVVAADFSKEFADFDKNYKNASYENKLKLHHSLKNIYIKTIINNDEQSKTKVLSRLVLSADSLGLDASLYKNELKTLYAKYPKLKPANTQSKQSTPKTTQAKDTKQTTQTNTKQTKFTQEKQTQLKDNKPTNTQSKDIKATNTQTKETPKQEETNKQIYILSSVKSNNQIKLQFNTQNIQDTKHHTFKSGDINHYIYVFENVIVDKTNQFELKDINASLVQYNKKDARFVVSSKKELDISQDIKDSLMIFDITEKQSTPKTTQAKDTKQTTQTNTKQTKFTQEKQTQLKDNKPTNTQSKDIKATNTQTKETPKQEETNKQIYILSSVKSNNQIKLQFNTQNIQDTKHHTFKSGDINHYIYVFENVIVDKTNQFELKDINASLVQYNKKDARFVVSSKKELDISQDIKDSLMIFDITEKQSTPKTTQAKDIKPQANTKQTKFTQEQQPQTKDVKSANTQPKILLSKQYKQSKLITIDAGHGGKDGGASFEGRLEKNITLQISLKLQKELTKRGYKVYLTRSNDKFIDLRGRTKIANDKMSDLFISIHANSVPVAKKDGAYGIETYFLSPARSERSKNAAAKENKSDIEEMDYFSKQTFLNFLNREKIISSNKLAIDIQSGMLANLRKHYKKDIKDGGVREAPFWVLVGALMPAVLIEVGYITHPVEGKNIATSSYQDNLAIGIANGIEAYFAKNH